MSRGRWRGFLLAALGLAFVGCNAWLAQFGAFASLRPALVQQCCECLASKSTRFPGATCAQAFVDVDGGLVFADDGGPAIPTTSTPDIDAGEVPCLCSDSLASCVEIVGKGGTILVTGACVYQGAQLFQFQAPPCESDCQGVIDFAPLQTAP
ncbi:MAG TPA: hypothetical protein VGO62_03955 [Myxococcota bacterium]|jgi:hypothetical protein